MSVHLALSDDPFRAICGGNAAMFTDKPRAVSCHVCERLIGRSPEPPSEGSRACMIYKHHRRLEDACDGCSLSATYCAANRDINREPCCSTCCHDQS